MNAGRQLCTVLVDEFVRCGVTDAVLSPGARSAPLALAVHDAAATGRLRLHVRIDERSAGYLALGLAKVSGRPVLLGCTSGTAAANLFPSVVEASEAQVPLLVLTADRPPELRFTGANQTIDQLRLFGNFPRWFCEVGLPESRAGAARYWRSMACQAWQRAHASAGPVHLNLAFRDTAVREFEPLPQDASEWSGRPEQAPWTTYSPSSPAAIATLSERPPVERGLVLVGDGAAQPGACVALAERWGWPVLAEPSSNARIGPNALEAYLYLLETPDFRDRHRPELVVSAGRPVLSRSVGRLLDTVDAHWALGTAGRCDPVRSASMVRSGVLSPGPAPLRRRSAWLAAWLSADGEVRRAVDRELDALPGLPEPRVAREMGRQLPAGGLLVAGPSLPIRHLDRHLGRRGDLRVIANRGAGGIDGLVSTAVGAALAHGGPAYALIGDLTFLHDQNGLIIGSREPLPDLTIVVLDNDGGGIFSELPERPAGEAFERLFGTAHGVDLAKAVAATGTRCQVVDRPAALPAALHGRGLQVVLIPSDREASAALNARLGDVARAVLSR